jgi:hypothetical protein
MFGCFPDECSTIIPTRKSMGIMWHMVRCQIIMRNTTCIKIAKSTSLSSFYRATGIMHQPLLITQKEGMRDGDGQIVLHLRSCFNCQGLHAP